MPDRDAAAYYADKLRQGEAYERYVVARLCAEGVVIACHEGRQAQILLGDTTLGIEIKYDDRMVMTGNLYIEVAEKRRARQEAWIPSGIRASSSARWYGIGNYRDWWLFARRRLCVAQAEHAILTIARGTSQGYLLPCDEASALSCRRRHWPDQSAGGDPVDPVAARQAVGTAVFGLQYPLKEEG